MASKIFFKEPFTKTSLSFMLKYIPYFSNSFWLRTFLHFTIVHTFLLNSNCKNVFPPASDSQPFSEFNLGLTISLEVLIKKVLMKENVKAF